MLIDAKIYEVDLDNEFAEGVESFLQKVGSSSARLGVTGNTPSGTNITGLSPATALAAAGGPGGMALTIGALVSKNNQLLGVLNASETRGRSRVISSPSIIATDSIPATMNVGTQVPVLSSQGLATGAQCDGTVIFASTVSNQSSGVTLTIMAHVNSSGVVTMMINQQVSAPVAPDRQLGDPVAVVFEPLSKHAGDSSGWRHHRHRRRHSGDPYGSAPRAFRC